MAGAAQLCAAPPTPAPIVFSRTPLLRLSEPVLHAFEAADFNGDGRTDLAFALPGRVELYQQREDGTFADTPDRSLPFPNPRGLHFTTPAADTPQAPRYLIVAEPQRLTFLKVDEAFAVTFEAPNVNLHTSTTSYPIWAGRLDGDSHLDIVIGPTLTRILASGASKTGYFKGPAENDNKSSRVASLLRTGPPDVVVLSNRELRIYGGPIKGTRIAPDNVTEYLSLPLTLPPLAPSLIVADFNGDQRPDLAVSSRPSRHPDENRISIFHQVVPMGFQSGAAPSLTLPFAGSLQNADFNGDGRADLAILEPARKGRLILYLQDARGNLRQAGESKGGGHLLKVGDIHSDGRADLLIATMGREGTLIEALLISSQPGS